MRNGVSGRAGPGAEKSCCSASDARDAMQVAERLEAALDPNGADRFHLEAEATRLAYDARNRLLADPELEVARIGLERALGGE